MKSLEVWRKGYKAEFSPGLGRSKCKVSPLPCFSWDSVGGVGQGQFCILHKSGIDSPVLWRSPGLSSGALLGCPLAVYAGIAGSIAGAPGRWLYRGRKLGGALILSFSGRSSFPLPSLPSFPFLLSGWCGALGGAGSAVWLVVSWAGAGCPLASCWPCPPGLALCAGAGRLFLPCLASSPSWVSALGFGAAASLCPFSWVLAFLCCPLVLACYVLGLGAGLGCGRCWAVQAVAVVAGWRLVCVDLAGC